MPNDNINWTKGGSGLPGNADATPNVPEYGESQPVLDTAGNATQPGVVFPEKRGTHPFDQGTPDFLPTSGSIPSGSTDVEDQDA